MVTLQEAQAQIQAAEQQIARTQIQQLPEPTRAQLLQQRGIQSREQRVQQQRLANLEKARQVKAAKQQVEQARGGVESYLATPGGRLAFAKQAGIKPKVEERTKSFRLPSGEVITETIDVEVYQTPYGKVEVPKGQFPAGFEFEQSQLAYKDIFTGQMVSMRPEEATLRHEPVLVDVRGRPIEQTKAEAFKLGATYPGLYPTSRFKPTEPTAATKFKEKVARAIERLIPSRIKQDLVTQPGYRLRAARAAGITGPGALEEYYPEEGFLIGTAQAQPVPVYKQETISTMPAELEPTEVEFRTPKRETIKMIGRQATILGAMATPIYGTAFTLGLGGQQLYTGVGETTMAYESTPGEKPIGVSDEAWERYTEEFEQVRQAKIRRGVVQAGFGALLLGAGAYRTTKWLGEPIVTKGKPIIKSRAVEVIRPSDVADEFMLRQKVTTKVPGTTIRRWEKWVGRKPSPIILKSQEYIYQTPQPIVIKGGVIQEPAYLARTRVGAKTSWVGRLTGKGRIITPEEFGKIKGFGKGLTARGEPVFGVAELEKFAKIKISPLKRGLKFEPKYIEPGRRTIRGEILGLQKEVKLLSTPRFDVFGYETLTRRTTFPFTKPRTFPKTRGISFVLAPADEAAVAGGVTGGVSQTLKLGKETKAIVQAVKKVAVKATPAPRVSITSVKTPTITPIIKPISKQVQLGIQIPKEAVGVKVVQRVAPISATALRVISRTKQLPRLALAQPVAVKKLQRIGQRAAQALRVTPAQRQIQRAIQRVVPRVTPATTLTPRAPTLRVTPRALLIPTASAARRRRAGLLVPRRKPMGFQVFVRRRGREVRVSPLGLRYGEALALGRKVTKRTAAAQFFLKPTRGRVGTLGLRPISERALALEFRKPIKRGKKVADPLRFVQRRTYRIATPGEFREITAKGIATRRGQKWWK